LIYLFNWNSAGAPMVTLIPMATNVSTTTRRAINVIPMHATMTRSCRRTASSTTRRIVLCCPMAWRLTWRSWARRNPSVPTASTET